MSDALHTVYKLTWDDFCAWYLEMIKPEFGEPIDKATYEKTVSLFESVLKVLHPFMPFITEELWHELKDRKNGECIIISEWPKVESYNTEILYEGSFAFELITQIRNVRNSKGLSPKEAIKLQRKESEEKFDAFLAIVQKLSNVSEITTTTTTTSAPIGVSFLVKTTEFTVPLDGKVDIVKEREALLKDIEYQKGFMASVDKKLSNEKFVNSAKPEVVEMERKKKADAESKIKALEESLSRL